MINNIFFTLAEAVQYDFMRRALLAGILVALSTSLLGVFIVLRRMSLIGDGLSHVSFAALSLGLLLGTSPLLISVPIVMLASIFIFRLAKNPSIDGDAAIGIISGTGVALGVLIASAGKGFNIDLFSYLFGSILSVTNAELVMLGCLAALVLFFILFFYHELFSITYDEDFALCTGIHAGKINILLTLLVSAAIVLGIRVTGTLLVSSLLIFPALTSLQIAGNFRKVMFFASMFSAFSVLIGIAVSYMLDLPSGAVIVMLNALIFFLILLIKKIKI
ncbi:MAG: ABC transporter [Spirochaetes bacterium GWF1_41_5]|nr:MAG: ABC transporter [Spirochaetes bacterium GWF1_41_5]HBE03557.1 ABC transporter [Spirochaetia bacterium]